VRKKQEMWCWMYVGPLRRVRKRRVAVEREIRLLSGDRVFSAAGMRAAVSRFLWQRVRAELRRALEVGTPVELWRVAAGFARPCVRADAPGSVPAPKTPSRALPVSATGHARQGGGR